MSICKDCIHYEICDKYVSPNESFPEVDGCRCFKASADVVEVVRCKDCFWWYERGFDAILNRHFGRCERPLGEYCEGGDFEIEENDFCSYGERREE